MFFSSSSFGIRFGENKLMFDFCTSLKIVIGCMQEKWR